LERAAAWKSLLRGKRRSCPWPQYVEKEKTEDDSMACTEKREKGGGKSP